MPDESKLTPGVDGAPQRQPRVWLAAIGMFAVAFVAAYFLRSSGVSARTETERRTAMNTQEKPLDATVSPTVVARNPGREDTQTARSSLSADAIFARVSPAVVQVLIQDRLGRIIGTGSGFLVSKQGLVATNHHVIKNAYSAHVVLRDKTKLSVVGVTALDEEADIAIIKVAGETFSQPLELAGNDLPPVGSKVYAIGNPEGFTQTLSDGLVSAHREKNAIPGFLRMPMMIQTTTPISPGSSGGPLVGTNGKVVGVTTLGSTGGAQNLNFAVPVSHVVRLLLQSKDNGKLIPFPLIQQFASKQGEPSTVDGLPYPDPRNRQSGSIELTEDNPTTLISTKSKDYSIYGLRLGITHRQAWAILGKTNSLIGVQDHSNTSRIYVYRRSPDGSKGEAVLYLIWEAGETSMSRLTVFQGCRGLLAPNVKRLLTFEAVDNQSAFKRSYLGYANRSKTTLDIPEISVKHKTYYYDDIGIEISHKHSRNGDEVVFALVPP